MTRNVTPDTTDNLPSSDTADSKNPLLERNLPEARMFSEETARELTRFVVGANQAHLLAHDA